MACDCSGRDGTITASIPLRSNPFLSIDWTQMWIATLVVLNGIDGVLTLCWVLSNRAGEANPLMDVLIQTHPLLFMLVKLALVNLGALLLWRLRKVYMVAVPTFFLVLVYSFVMWCHMLIA